MTAISGKATYGGTAGSIGAVVLRHDRTDRGILFSLAVDAWCRFSMARLQNLVGFVIAVATVHGSESV